MFKLVCSTGREEVAYASAGSKLGWTGLQWVAGIYVWEPLVCRAKIEVWKGTVLRLVVEIIP